MASGKWKGREGERAGWLAYSAVQIPLDLFVYITLSLSPSPLLLSLSHFHSFCLNHPHAAADKHADSFSRQIASLLLSWNGTPTTITCVRVSYSIPRDPVLRDAPVPDQAKQILVGSHSLYSMRLPVILLSNHIKAVNVVTLPCNTPHPLTHNQRDWSSIHLTTEALVNRLEAKWGD